MSEKNYITSYKGATQTPKGIHRIRQFGRNLLLSAASMVQSSNSENSLRLLYCHYVFDDQRDGFDRLISALKGYGEFVDTETCINIIEGKIELDRNYFHLSFDDGFRNIYSNALPILKKHKIPSIFFVPSAIVSADYDAVSNYCTNAINHKAAIEMASWEDLSRLLDAGVDIGSHTRTHARFSEISGDREKLEEEIFGSKDEIERKLGQECKYISWPYGTLADADPTSLDMVRRAGYSACFGAFRGKVEYGITDKYAIPRHHFEAQWPWPHVRYFALGGMESQR